MRIALLVVVVGRKVADGWWPLVVNMSSRQSGDACKIPLAFGEDHASEMLQLILPTTITLAGHVMLLQKALLLFL